MAKDAKKEREREVFNVVYGRRGLYEVVPSERPDFLARYHARASYFGVEIAEFFHSETNARIQRIPGYAATSPADITGTDLVNQMDVRFIAAAGLFHFCALYSMTCPSLASSAM
jgi:hypothetical protein